MACLKRLVETRFMMFPKLIDSINDDYKNVLKGKVNTAWNSMEFTRRLIKAYLKREPTYVR